MLTRLSVALAACAVLLAGCGGETVAEEDKILIPSTSSPLGPSDGGNGEPSAGAKPSRDKKLPNVVVAARVGIRFTAPAGWAPWTAKDLRGTSRSAELQELLDRMGLTREQFASSLDDFDAFLVGYAGNLNVSTTGAATALPSEAELRSQYAAVTSSIEAIDDVDTAAGPGRVLHYSITLGSRTQYGAALMLLTGGRIVNLTITTADPSEARSRMAKVLPTIRRA